MLLQPRERGQRAASVLLCLDTSYLTEFALA